LISGIRRARPIRFDSFWRRGFVCTFLGMFFSLLDTRAKAEPRIHIVTAPVPAMDAPARNAGFL